MSMPLLAHNTASIKITKKFKKWYNKMIIRVANALKLIVLNFIANVLLMDANVIHVVFAFVVKIIKEIKKTYIRLSK
jgi:hypothetical protein